MTSLDPNLSTTYFKGDNAVVAYIQLRVYQMRWLKWTIFAFRPDAVLVASAICAKYTSEGCPWNGNK